MNLVSLDEFKTYKGIKKSDDDSKLSLLIKAATQLAKTYCKRTFIDYYNTDKVEYHNGEDYDIIFLEEFPIVSITSLEASADGVNYTALTENTDFFVETDTGIVYTADNLPFTSGAVPKLRSVKVTYKAGFDEVPDDLKIAVMDLVEYYRQEEYTPRKSFESSSIENVGFRSGNKADLPSHIKRVFEFYKAD